MKLTILTHYDEDDTEFIGDYCCIEILNDKGESIYFQGDDYHDKGQDKVEGFIAGLKYALDGDVSFEKKEIADGKY